MVYLIGNLIFRIKELFRLKREISELEYIIRELKR